MCAFALGPFWKRCSLSSWFPFSLITLLSLGPLPSAEWFSYIHGIITMGEDLHGHLVQPSLRHQDHPLNHSLSSASHLNGLNCAGRKEAMLSTLLTSTFGVSLHFGHLGYRIMAKGGLAQHCRTSLSLDVLFVDVFLEHLLGNYLNEKLEVI